jgi:hypothetical protein
LIPPDVKRRFVQESCGLRDGSTGRGCEAVRRVAWFDFTRLVLTVPVSVVLSHPCFARMGRPTINVTFWRFALSHVSKSRHGAPIFMLTNALRSALTQDCDVRDEY